MNKDEMHVTGLTLQERAKHLAEELGFGPEGKSGGVILVVVDGEERQTAIVHAGGNHPLFDAFLHAFKKVIKAASNLLGGTEDERISSVSQWRKKTKRS